ncbi:hypothetical protein N657DRAFT_637072 [Parathielavia appendiculata]|uniref:BZIP domain-containing protein n=1 Tax=Parathielavia appendiculata TaxID=2587402 RepID=A0AAN6TSB5_9PEZI|nr:hypothetical protein N657DRAFT_637072 [Parathielavia appendiculata]
MPSSPLDQPRTRQRAHKPPPTLTVPDIAEDAAERKRVLNVLAQRRYRQRKREARLGSSQSRESVAQIEGPSEHSHATSPHSGFGTGATTTEAAAQDVAGFPFLPLDGSDLPIPFPPSNAAAGSSDIVQVEETPLQCPAFSWNETYYQPALLASFPVAFADEAEPSSLASPSGTLNTSLRPNPFPTSTSSPASIPITPGCPPNNNYNNTNNDISSGGSTPYMVLPNHDDDNTTILISSTPPPTAALSGDSYHLAVPPLTLLRALTRIATRLNAMPSVFSLTAASPFTIGSGPHPVSQLPRPWQPTPTQLTVPHHPVLDLLPWSGVRDRLIGFLTLGLSVAGDGGDGNEDGNESGGVWATAGGGGTGSGLVDFIYDMEDGGEGIRVWGADPYDEANWEVGQVVFERWWFVFDRRVVERSNHLRRRRGAPPLRVVGTRSS